MKDSFHVAQHAYLREIAERMARGGAPSAPLYRAAADGRIALISIADHRLAWPTETVARLSRPTVVLIGGDPGWGEPTFAPNQWVCAEPARSWAMAAIIHGGRGEPHHYSSILPGMAEARRVVIVETDSQFVHAWTGFFSSIPTLTLVPEGGVHPVAPEVVH